MRAVLGSILLALAAPAAASPEPSFAPYEVHRLVDGVRIMAQPPDHLAFASSNIVLIEQADGVVVVDSGWTRHDGDLIVRYIRSFTAKPVKALIFTHWHNDHIQGASQIRAAWPHVRIIATAGTRDGIAGPAGTQGLGFTPNPAADATLAKQMRDAAADADKRGAEAATPWLKLRYARMAREFREGIPAEVGTHFVAPTEILGDADIVIDDPRLPVQVMFLGRANTAGDAVVWLPNQRLVASGDIVVSPVPFGFGSYPGEWIETLKKVRALGFDVLVPGHGQPQEDSGYIDRLIATITEIRTQVARLAGEGLTLDQVRARFDAKAAFAVFGAMPRREPAFDALWLHPMIENAYKEAKGIPIVQGEGELPGGS